jgi:PAT family beta-lactamase induction signal transducer AmpG
VDDAKNETRENFMNRKLFTKEMLIILAMGFSSGLPLALTGGTLQAWMKSEGVDLGTIGLFASVGLPYNLKFLWSPLMDRFTLFAGARRRSWMIASQVLLILSVIGLALSSPKADLQMVAILSILVSFFSASQDIVLDAWRRETLSDDDLGFGSSVFVSSYLFAFRMISGALALILADSMPWSSVYLIMAACLGVGLIASIFCKEPSNQFAAPRSLKEAVVEPFLDFFSKPGAWVILAFILFYKLGDNLALQMTTPFYLELGFSKSEIGAITKLTGWISLIIGGLVGGLIIRKIKIIPSLFYFGIVQGMAIYGFAILNFIGKDTTALAAVIAFDNFAVGMGTAAFVAYMATLTNKKFTATQYALLTSFMGLPRTLLSAPTGYLAKSLGWNNFFIFCTLMALPGLALIPIIRKHKID